MSWDTTGPPIHEGEDEYALKMRFAEIVAANPERRLSAGYSLFTGPENYGRAMQAQSWLRDPMVVAEIERLQTGTDAASILPTKEAVAKEILNLARELASSHGGGKDAIGAYKLYGEYVGDIQKVPTAIVDNRVINVLKVPVRDQTPEDDADFDTRFYAQQTKLIADAKSIRTSA